MGRVSLMMSLEKNVLSREEIYPKTAGQLKVFSPGVCSPEIAQRVGRSEAHSYLGAYEEHVVCT